MPAAFASPFTRKWLEAEPRPDDPESQDADNEEGALHFRVLSFNLLAEALAQGSASKEQLPCPAAVVGPDVPPAAPSGILFVTSAADAEGQPRAFRCPEQHLAWDYRWPRLKAEILSHGADLIGLQELDLDDKLSHGGAIASAFDELGYASVSAKKKGRAADGVSLLWRRSRLEAVGEPEVWRLTRGSVHVAVAQRLRLDGKEEFLAVATHLKAGDTQAAENERMGQAEGLLSQIRSRPMPTVVLADLNANCRPLYGREQVPVQPEVYSLLCQGGFRSVFKDITGREPDFTCWGGWHGYDVAGVFDYTLCWSKRIRPCRVLGLPPASEVLQFADRLPNEHYPSDHLAMVTDLQLLPGRRQPRGPEPPANPDGKPAFLQPAACRPANATEAAPVQDRSNGAPPTIKAQQAAPFCWSDWCRCARRRTLSCSGEAQAPVSLLAAAAAAEGSEGLRRR